MSSSDSEQNDSSTSSPANDLLEKGKISSLKDLYDLISEQKNILLNDDDESDAEEVLDTNINLLEEQMEQVKQELKVCCAKVKDIQHTLDRGSGQKNADVGGVCVGVALENKVNQTDFKQAISDLTEELTSVKRELATLENSLNVVRSQCVDKNMLEFKMRDHKPSENLVGLESRIQEVVNDAVNAQIDPLTRRLEQFIKAHISDVRKSFNTKLLMSKQ